jgi:hypothetical protein
LDIKGENKIVGFVGINQEKKIRIIRKGINSLSIRHAIGNIKANAMSRQERYFRIDYLRPRSACRNKLISIRLMGISPWSSLLTRSQESGKKKKKKGKVARLIGYFYLLSSAKNVS